MDQCVRFSNDPRLIHERAVRKIGKYLSETSTRSIIYDPHKTQGIECYVDADFSGGWDRDYGKRAENVYLDLNITHFILGAQSYEQVQCKRKLL